MMRIKTFWFTLFAIACCACDDNTSSLGVEIIPDSDGITIHSKNFNIQTQTVQAEAELARTSTCYLGNYTDPETGTNIHSDFMAQFHCLENFEFPEKIEEDQAIRTDLRLFIDKFTGDSLALCRVSVYPLTQSLDNDKNYYTDIDPTEFYDPNSAPIATTTFTVSDRTLSDSARYDGNSYRNIRIQLPSSVGTDIIRKYKDHPEYFKDADSFEKNVCKGYYIKLDKGEGVMMDIYVSQLQVYFNYYIDSSTGKLDSLVTGISTFSATEEVIQATSVKAKGMEQLIQDQEATYVKTPCGLYTEMTLPIEEIAETNDTINGARLIFTRYNSENALENYQLPAPQYLLMVRKKDMYSFFENNDVANDNTSYITTFTSSYNTYTYSNISHLISYIRKEWNEGKKKDPLWVEKNPDWNKVILIPVTPTYNTSGTLVAVNHDLSLSSAKLRNSDIKLQIIFSRFNQD